MKTLSKDEGPATLSHDQLVALIRKHPFAEGMSEEHLNLLAEFAMPVDFNVGQLILREGDLANRFYLIQEGTLSLETYAPNYGITCIQTVGGGEVLGWSWMFDPPRWSFDARAVSKVKGIFFYGTALLELCESNHSLGYELMKRISKVLVNRLQSTRKRLVTTLAQQVIR